MKPDITIIKVGGNELDNPDFLDGLVHRLADTTRPVILVHGGGKEISAALTLYGEEVQFIDGIRVTPATSMDIMEMVVCGRINKRLVARLVGAGRGALGLSGVDLGLLRCVPYRPDGRDLGRVGQISAVAVERLWSFVQTGLLPVLAPVALGQHDSLAYNVNADHVALGVAAALAQDAAGTGSVELVFVSNVPGVLIDEQVAPHLSAHEVEQHIQQGTIKGGMIPKVRSALDALEQGVATVRITNLPGLGAGGTQIGKQL